MGNKLHIKYRPDIDGMRAVAVLAVVVFHFATKKLQGGFVGVDIFFVISGFLISSIIFKGLVSNSFSFSDFYARRIRRIFPSLIVVLFSCYFFGWFSLLSDEFSQLGKHIFGGSVFISNFILWDESGYFDVSSEVKPLLHLWSLGVEEQFYIIFPFLIALFWYKKYSILFFLSFLFCVSFLINLSTFFENNHIGDFYSPVTRFWELMLGSIISYISIFKKRFYDVFFEKKIYIFLREIVLFLAFFILILSMFYFNKKLIYPGFYALIPVALSGIIIFLGDSSLLGRYILSNPILVWFGKISFPLYLWHWPIYSYYRIIYSVSPPRDVKIWMFFLSVILAWVTYVIIEKPIRYGKQKKIINILLLSVMSIVAIVGYITYLNKGFVHRYVNTVNGQVSKVIDFKASDKKLYTSCGSAYFNSPGDFECKVDIRGNIKFALLGDSKAFALFPGLIENSTAKGRWMAVWGGGENGVVPILSSDNRFKLDENGILNVLERVSDEKDIKVVAFAVAIRSLFNLKNRDEFGVYHSDYLDKLGSSKDYNYIEKGMVKAISILKSKGKKVIFVMDNPALPDPRDCFGRKTSSAVINHILKIEDKDPARCFIKESDFKEKTALYRKLINDLEMKFPHDLRIINPESIYCKNNVCGPEINGQLMYEYTDHISYETSKYVGKLINTTIYNY